jgi:hypothetical protein
VTSTVAPPRPPAPRRGRRRRPHPVVAPLAVGVVAVAVCVVLAVVDPEDRTLWTPRCPFRAATGLDCPGCGGTRALTALLRGDVGLALSHNVVTVALLPLLVWGWVGWLAVRAGWRHAAPEPSTRLAWTVAIVLPAFTLARNLPWGPFAWLGSGAG